MAKRKPTKPRLRNGLETKVGFETVPDSDIEVIAYAFDRQGRFLDSVPLKEGGAKLQVNAKQAPRAGGSTPCDKAAFAETLDVDALATDGWSHHLWYLDKAATPVAFALEPKVVGP